MVGGAAILAAAGCAGASKEQPPAPTDPKRAVHATTTPSVSATPALEPAAWPQYGRDAMRQGVAQRSAVAPPFAIRWRVAATSYIEFPPVMARQRLFLGTDRGRIMAIDAGTGAVRWARETGRCVAASAAVRRELVYFALMDPPPCGHDPGSGEALAVRADTGRVVWSFRAAVMEGSPLLVGRTVYIGSWDGRLYALDATTGHVRWSFKTGDRIKGGAAYSDGTVFVGSYDGHVYAVAARDGKLRWVASVGGRVYATPAVGGGSVVIGTLGGAVHALDVSTGHTRWTHQTGSYVYSSPAIWRGTAYIGSYDHHLYALDIATGAVRWSFDAGAAVSGTPTVVNGIVYVARCLGCIAHAPVLHMPRRTFGLDARTGRLVWTFADGEYTPVVADTRQAYLVGYTHLYALARARPAARE